MKTIDRKYFFDHVRKSLFGGTLTASQTANMSSILFAIERAGITMTSWAAAILATAYIEVGRAMAPVREGFASSDAGAQAAVTKLYKAGKIKVNYGLPTGPYGKSYYGRGYPQLTWIENYEKTGVALGLNLVKDPDLMLKPHIAADAMVWGMRTGAFRAGKSLDMLRRDIEGPDAFFAAREIINGDKNKLRGKVKVGTQYAGAAMEFQKAIRWIESGDPQPLDTEPKKVQDVPEVKAEPSTPVATETKENANMDKLAGVIRHILSAVGGALVGIGVVEAADWATLMTNVETIIGTVLTVAATGASVLAKGKGVIGFLKGLFG